MVKDKPTAIHYNPAWIYRCMLNHLSSSLWEVMPSSYSLQIKRSFVFVLIDSICLGHRWDVVARVRNDMAEVPCVTASSISSESTKPWAAALVYHHVNSLFLTIKTIIYIYIIQLILHSCIKKRKPGYNALLSLAVNVPRSWQGEPSIGLNESEEPDWPALIPFPEAGFSAFDYDHFTPNQAAALFYGESH